MPEPRRYLNADSASYGGLVDAGLDIAKATAADCQKALSILAQAMNIHFKQITVTGQNEHLHVKVIPSGTWDIDKHDNEEHGAFFLGVLAAHTTQIDKNEFHSLEPDLLVADSRELAHAINKAAERCHDTKLMQALTAIQAGRTL